jgi:alpha-tubulin suppressor-like RCC1 family protein
LPVQVGSDLDWDTVSAGRGHTCATKTDHRLYCWGSNDDGALLDGRGWTPTPVAVPAP